MGTKGETNGVKGKRKRTIHLTESEKMKVKDIANLINQKIRGEKGVDWNLTKRTYKNETTKYVVIYLHKSGKRKKVLIPLSWFSVRNGKPYKIKITHLYNDYKRKAHKYDNEMFSKYGLNRVEHSDPLGRV